MNGRAVEKRQFYSYVLEVSSMAAAATGSDSFTVEGNADFVWTKTTFMVDIASDTLTEATAVLPLISWLVTDTGSSAQLWDGEQPLPNLAGRGNIPFILPIPYTFGRNSTVRAQFTNYSDNATYTNLKVSLIGYRNFGYVQAAA